MTLTKYTKEFFEENWRGSLSSAQEIIPILLEFVRPKNVVELGCGVGAWLSVLKRFGVHEVVGVDGDYVTEDQMLISKHEFVAHDLTKPFQMGKSFDLAISLEVAEHLPRSSAQTFVKSLAKLAPVILFSAAIPFQGGTQHVNEQWPDFWASMFRAEGFEPVDCLRKRVWQNEQVEWWYAQNMFIYATREILAGNAALEEAFERTSPSQLCLVHPRKYLAVIDPKRMGLKQMLSAAPAVVLNAGKRRVKSSVTFLRNRT